MPRLKYSVIITERETHHMCEIQQYHTFTDAVNKLDNHRATYAVGLARGTHHAELVINCDAFDVLPVAP